MPLEDVILPKTYKDGKVLFEKMLDDWRIKSEEAFADINLNFAQLVKDCFSAGYVFDNDGNPNKPISLEDRLDLFEGGGGFIDGTASDSFSINSDGNAATLDTVGLTSTHVYTFPDIDGEFMITTAIQDSTGKKTFSGGIAGNTVFDGSPHIIGSLDVDTDLNVDGNAVIDLLLTVGGAADFNSTANFDGNVTFDTDLLFVDAANNKVLIGAITSVNADIFQVIRTAAGSSALALIKNMDNTNAASNAKVSIVVGGATAGDPAQTFDITGVQAWTMGVDNSDGDVFKIATGLTLGGAADRLILSQDGQLKVAFADPPLANYMNSNSSIKAYCAIEANAEVDSYNVSSIGHPNTGQYDVNVDTNFSSATYTGCATQSGAGVEGSVQFSSTNAGQYFISTFNAGVDTDANNYSIVAGVQ